MAGPAGAALNGNAPLPATPGEFFAEARRRFRDAAARAPGGDIGIRLAGRPIRLRFAGTAMRAVVEPVFDHLPRAPIESAELTIALWDTRTTGIAMPPRPWGPDDHGALGIIAPFCDGRYVTKLDPWGVTLSMLDGESNEAVYWAPDARRMPVWERGHPLDLVFAHWLARSGLRMVHAGAVGSPLGGALIVGAGGTGKSTTVLACLGSPIKIVSDDYLVIAADGAVPIAHGVYGSAYLHTDHRARFPQLMTAVENLDRIGHEKPLMWLAARRPDAMLPAVPITAIVLPQVRGHGPTSFRPAAASLALRALAPSSLLQLGLREAAAFNGMAALCRRLPSYTLELGAGVDDIPERLTAILSDAARACGPVGSG